MNLLDFKFLASISGLASGTVLNPQVNSPLRGTFNIQLNQSVAKDSPGYGDQGFQWVGQTLPAGTGLELDLSSGLVNQLNESISAGNAFKLVKFAAFVHEPGSLASKIRFGAGTFPFLGLFSDPADTITLRPGQFNIMGSPTVLAMPVTGLGGTAPVNKDILVMNLDGTKNALWSIYLFGAKKTPNS